LACLEILSASSTIAITITAATAITAMPSPSPICQPVEDAITASRRLRESWSGVEG
jgi:hypothetical protein